MRVHLVAQRPLEERSMNIFTSIIALSSILFLANTCGAQSTAYPTKPIRYIVGFPSGGSTDLVARLVAGKLSEAFGLQVVVDNRPGAGGSVAATVVARAAPDGYTLYHAGITMAINPALRKNLPYDTFKDFAPITLHVKLPTVLLVNSGVPVKTIQDLIAYAKASPGKINYGSSGAGAAPHLAMELLKKQTGIDMMHIPYKGSAPAINDLMGGRITAMFDNLPATLIHVKGGKVRALAVGSAQRSPELPDVPTISETVIPGFEVTVWYGMFTQAAVSKQIIEKLNTSVVKILGMSDVRRQLADIGAEPSPMTPTQFGAFLKSETVKWATAVKDAGLTAE
jgi:tripartite-type tricarboxylate transporter receptor subunit TctC